jgi:hypothetical protein
MRWFSLVVTDCQSGAAHWRLLLDYDLAAIASWMLYELASIRCSSWLLVQTKLAAAAPTPSVCGFKHSVVHNIFWHQNL